MTGSKTRLNKTKKINFLILFLRCNTSLKSIFKQPKKKANIKNLSVKFSPHKKYCGTKNAITAEASNKKPKLFSIVFINLENILFYSTLILYIAIIYFFLSHF